MKCVFITQPAKLLDVCVCATKCHALLRLRQPAPHLTAPTQTYTTPTQNDHSGMNKPHAHGLTTHPTVIFVNPTAAHRNSHFACMRMLGGPLTAGLACAIETVGQASKQGYDSRVSATCAAAVFVVIAICVTYR